jgi:polysaccharide pyruvyl transferase WcaK-like protein
MTDEAIGSSAPRIGVMGPFGYGNLGDAAIVDAFVGSVRARMPEVRFVGFTLEPDDTEARHGFTSYPLSRLTIVAATESTGAYGRFLTKLGASGSGIGYKVERILRRAPAELGMLRRSYRALDDVDALVMCGSGQIQDYWGGGGPWSYPYTTLRWAILARLRGVPFMMVSVGAGPVDASLSRAFFRASIALSSYRSYRDEWTRDFVRDTIGSGKAGRVAPDLAFSLELPDAGGADAAMRRPIIGINPIGYYKEGNWPEVDEQKYRQYRAAIVDLVGWLVRDGASIRFLKGEAHFDQIVVDDLTAAIRQEGIDMRSIHDPSVQTVDELLGELARCDVVVASRYHNVLLSYLLGRPVVALSYQQKTESLMNHFGQVDSCMPIGEATAGALYDAVTAALADEDFAESASQRSEPLRKELDEQYEVILSQI